MCPDRQLLSVYFDGEMPSPWKEKMDAHIAGCPHCAGRLKAYRCITMKGAAGEPAAIEAAQGRLWQKLELRSATPPPVPSSVIWRRRISIPLPAAAAVLLLVALAFLFTLRVNTPTEAAEMTLAAEAEFDAPGIIPITDMEDVLQYLGSRDNGELIILRLPESRSFVNYGEPAIIRAADYSRQGTPGRRK
jgi:hypothetical protein